MAFIDHVGTAAKGVVGDICDSAKLVTLTDVEDLISEADDILTALHSAAIVSKKLATRCYLLWRYI